MHIPPYYKRASWQRFFVGTVVGAIVAYCVFVYMYGEFHERWVEENLELRSDYNDLKLNYDSLQESKQQLDEEAKKKITIETITISIDNKKQLKLDNDSLTAHQLVEQMKQQISDVIGRDILSLSENYKLLEAAIQNKIYKVDEFMYEASVTHLFIVPSSPAELILRVQLKIAS
ncbi:sporulation membrane protein YtrI [Radiobacillus sp. PE A8.2]|uniref:sporulation membrane protein YtrI n=1 Tax=Radiobacillus sp. PE A8.2 TaxID=3380349 RepID=UPI003890FC13